MAELGLGITGVIIGVPALIDSILRLAAYLTEKARVHRHIEDQRPLCDQIISLNKSQSRDLLLFFHSLEDVVSQNFRDELHYLFQTLRAVYESLIQAFPATEVAAASAGPIQQRLSGRSIKKIEIGIKQLEEWNDRLLKRAMIFLFLGSKDLPTSGERERVLRSYEALDQVDALRKAVRATLSNTQMPEKLLLDQDDSSATRTQVPYSSLWIVQPPQGAVNAAARLVEDRLYSDDADAATINALRRTVRDVASILHKAEPEAMGVLRCFGFRHEKVSNRFELHLEFPRRAHSPRSLQDLLKDPINQRVGVAHPLDQRINLAKKLASAVFYIHSGDFVHKNIPPSNTIVFEPELASDIDPAKVKYHQYPRALGAPFLVGYDGIRKADAVSQRLRVEDWKKNI